MTVVFSCRKENNDNDKDDDDSKTEEIDITGTWTASSGEYNLSLTITSTNYNFALTEPGNGGVTDNGTYEIAEDGNIFFVNSHDDPLASGQLINGKLHLTFVNYMFIMMLGNAAASNTAFTRSEDGSGSLVVQNLSDSYEIVTINFYDKDGTYLDSDTEVDLEPGYQIKYSSVKVGSYIIEVINNGSKSFKSKSCKVIKNKLTVLQYNGSALDVFATGINDE
jgi:hypothetical protein